GGAPKVTLRLSERAGAALNADRSQGVISGFECPVDNAEVIHTFLENDLIVTITIGQASRESGVEAVTPLDIESAVRRTPSSQSENTPAGGSGILVSLEGEDGVGKA